jgi:hypothetical protein
MLPLSFLSGKGGLGDFDSEKNWALARGGRQSPFSATAFGLQFDSVTDEPLGISEIDCLNCAIS